MTNVTKLEETTRGKITPEYAAWNLIKISLRDGETITLDSLLAKVEKKVENFSKIDGELQSPAQVEFRHVMEQLLRLKSRRLERMEASDQTETSES